MFLAGFGGILKSKNSGLKERERLSSDVLYY